MTPLRVLQIADSVEVEASGLTYVALRLTSSLAELGYAAVLLTGDDAIPALPQCKLHAKFKRDYSTVPLLNRLGISRGLRQALSTQAKTCDIVHSHGLWRMASVYAAGAARGHHRPHVVSIHGMLSAEALRISRVPKLAFWPAAQRRILESAACLHATSDREHDEIRAAGLRRPVAIIPNGIDIDKNKPPSKADGPRTVAFIGRLHPIKNLETLLVAWARVQGAHPNWTLHIAGDGDESYVRSLQAAATRLTARVTFEGPVYGDKKRALYQRAHGFILPSLSENFGITVAEALSESTPVICSKAAPWAGLVTHRCGYWVDNSVEGLAAALDMMMKLSLTEIQAMGERGRAWMARDFAWPAIAGEMIEVYNYLLRRAAQPASVRLA